MKSRIKLLALTTTLVAAISSGCATKEYVHEYVNGQLVPVKAHGEKIDGRLNATDAAVASLKAQDAAQSGINSNVQTQLTTHEGRISKAEVDVQQLSKTAQDAMERAMAAGKLASGKLVYEVAMSDDTLKFKPDQARLNKDGMAALDAFAAKLKADNKNVFLEIQGHTDSRGEEATNMRVGEARAEAVRRYLNMKGGIPLHRMSAISYGESMPVATNMNKAGRSQNRRVVLVVLQ
jgi:outer membrane protein OmpA-like peptidoglycan-associated protein